MPLAFAPHDQVTCRAITHWWWESQPDPSYARISNSGASTPRDITILMPSSTE